ncbi:PREDICTED: uncharacterized protein LOC106552317 [Thamnophis sirtalis]|uniref:Uncharacterized protein LOC106552317 n=1 Tax=Thamnophis sirtalis TaxID=35019 RepID=A0A6I9YPF1_9SAUR|nr:PREDICTED: uncharacterized protein LOC106552317 [Thamnophis sirtalis]
MAQPFLFLLFLLSFFTGSLAQFTLTQPPSVSVSSGGTVRITCTRAGGSFSDHYVYWYQQKPGSKPLAVIIEDSERPSGIPERFSGSVDLSSKTATLSISNVQPEDEADYYCFSGENNQCTLNLSMTRRGPPRRNVGFRRSVLAHFSAMAQPFLFLLFLLTFFSGALAQFTMTQPPSVSVSPGGTVRITCTRTGGSFSDYYVSWYQQKPGTKPLAVIYKDSERPSGIPERFSDSYDSSSNSATLTISNVQPEDEADYYCLTYDGNNQCTVIALDGEL